LKRGWVGLGRVGKVSRASPLCVVAALYRSPPLVTSVSLQTLSVPTPHNAHPPAHNRALIAPRGFPHPCPTDFALRLWIYSPASGNVLLSALALPLRWHFWLQLFALARITPGVPTACACVQLTEAPGAAAVTEALCVWRARLTALNQRVGFPLLQARLPKVAASVAGSGTCASAAAVGAAAAAGRPTAAAATAAAACLAVTDGCCLQSLYAIAAAQTLVVTTALTILIETASRAAWLSTGAPGAPPAATACPLQLQLARRQLLATCVANLLVCALALPFVWEVSGVFASWWLGGAPSVMQAAAAVTAAAVQVFMRLFWLPLVLQLVVAGPLLRLWSRLAPTAADTGGGGGTPADRRVSGPADAAAAAAAAAASEGVEPVLNAQRPIAQTRLRPAAARGGRDGSSSFWGVLRHTLGSTHVD